MNTFAGPGGTNTFGGAGAPAAPLLAQPALTNPRDPMQALAALMTPQSYGSTSAAMPFGMGDLLRLMQGQPGQQTGTPIPGQGMGAGPGPGTGGLY